MTPEQLQPPRLARVREGTITRRIKALEVLARKREDITQEETHLRYSEWCALRKELGRREVGDPIARECPDCKTYNQFIRKGHCPRCGWPAPKKDT